MQPGPAAMRWWPCCWKKSAMPSINALTPAQTVRVTKGTLLPPACSMAPTMPCQPSLKTTSGLCRFKGKTSLLKRLPPSTLHKPTTYRWPKGIFRLRSRPSAAQPRATYRPSSRSRPPAMARWWCTTNGKMVTRLTSTTRRKRARSAGHTTTTSGL